MVTADETGLVKVTEVESGNVLAVCGIENQHRERGARGLCWSNIENTSTDYDQIHVGRDNGVVERWNVKHRAGDGDKLQGAADFAGGAELEGFPTGLISLSWLPQVEKDGESILAACNAAGEVHMAGAKTGAAFGQFSVGGPVDAVCCRGKMMATGGRENDVKLWDLTTQECTWRAKNVPMDYKLQLRIPVWVSAIDGLQTEKEDPDLCKLLAGTSHKHLRIYDARAKRRPSHSVNYGDYRITNVRTARDGTTVLVGDVSGAVTSVDLRNMRKVVRKYGGGAGSVRDIALHPTLPCFAAVGLDRMCRVYTIGASEPLATLYLKQRCSRVLFTDEGKLKMRGEKEGDEGVEFDSEAEEYDMGDVHDSDRSDHEEAHSENEDNSSLYSDEEQAEQHTHSTKEYQNGNKKHTAENSDDSGESSDGSDSFKDLSGGIDESDSDGDEEVVTSAAMQRERRGVGAAPPVSAAKRFKKTR